MFVFEVPKPHFLSGSLMPLRLLLKEQGDFRCQFLNEDTSVRALSVPAPSVFSLSLDSEVGFSLQLYLGLERHLFCERHVKEACLREV